VGTDTTVLAPDGSRWRVPRRWLERPLPGLRRWWRKLRGESADVSNFGLGLDALDSAQATRELREAIASAGPPERLSLGRPLATRPRVGR
jgi:hypothetical protein